MMTRNLLLVAATAALLGACKKDLDSPPERTIPVGSVMTVAELKALWAGAPVHFDEARSVYAVVTSDETDGNFYKNISVQDRTGGITLRLLNSGGLYVGDSVRIYLPGTVLSPYNGLMQLDSVNVDNNIIKQAALVHVEPRVVSISDLTVAALDTLQSTLIKLEDVEFRTSDASGGTWADALNQATGERYVENCALDQVMIRTSGYASYAAQPLPTGKGSIVCIAGIFGSTIQLYNRSLAGVNMNGPRCPGQELPFYVKNFQDQSLTSGGWTQQIITGSTGFAVQDLGSTGNFYAIANNFTSGQAAETWLISPAIDISGIASPKLAFRNASRFSGPVIEVLVSTNYDGVSAPSSATWTALSPVLDTNTSSYVWTESGLMDISAFSSANFHVAFKYTAPAPSGSAWEIDDIRIIE